MKEIPWSSRASERRMCDMAECTAAQLIEEVTENQEWCLFGCYAVWLL
jgi:hypothetical protein